MRPIDNLRQSAINLTTKLLFALQLAAECRRHSEWDRPPCGPGCLSKGDHGLKYGSRCDCPTIIVIVNFKFNPGRDWNWKENSDFKCINYWAGVMVVEVLLLVGTVLPPELHDNNYRHFIKCTRGGDKPRLPFHPLVLNGDCNYSARHWKVIAQFRDKMGTLICWHFRGTRRVPLEFNG